MNRRTFAQRALAFGAIAMTSTFNLGCWLSTTLFNHILAYVSLGTQAFQSVIAILEGAGVISLGAGASIDVIISLVKAGFVDLQTAVTAYNNAPSDQKATLLEKISLVLSILQGDLQQFWNDLSIPDAKLAALVQGLLGVIVTTLAGFATQLPPTPQGREKLARASQLPKQLPALPKKRTPAQFKSEFNGDLKTAGMSAYAIH